MATVSSDLTLKWSVLQFGTPNIEFWYPADVPSEYVRIYHGISNNVPNRRIIKTIKMGVSAGGVRSFRNVGYEDELIKLDIVLATKEEAEAFTNFFTDIIKGSANVFYYRNNFTGQESIVRLMSNSLPMGEGEGHPYSFSLLMRKEDPYSGSSLTIKYNIIEIITFPILIAGHAGNFSLVLLPTSSYKLLATGDNSGQLGLGDGVDRSRFEQVGVATDWASGSGGGDHAHVTNDSGDLYSSGLNGYGQLGLGDTSTRQTFTQVSGVWDKVSSGANFSAGIKTDGTLWAWGQNNFGQLGQGSFDSSPHSTPLQIGSDIDWADVKCGAYFIIAKKSNGTLWGCGQDNNGQLGQGSTATRRTSLVQIGVLTDWDTFDAGWSHTLALKDDGALWAWGDNSYGQLGDGSTTDRYTPVQIGSSAWIKISAAGQSNGTSYGIKAAGTLWSWGYNVNYELGIGSSDFNPHPDPILIDADTIWMDVSGGGSHAIASKSNDEIWGWGWNGRGEIGLGYTTSVTVPTRTFLTGSQVSFIWDIEGGGPPPPP